MEGHNTNSSLDTLILDCEEDIESEKLQNTSSLDILIQNSEDELKPKKHRRHYKSKSEHRRRGEQRKKSTDCVRTKYVTQKIHVERQNLKCVINLNTTVCDHRNSHQRGCNTKLSGDLKSRYIERPVPHCFRQVCHHPRHHDTRFCRHSNEHCKADLHNPTRDLNIVNLCMKKTKHGNRYRQHSWLDKKSSKEKLILKQNQSKIISPSKMQLELSYEDISTTSMDSYLEVPSSYKHVAKNTSGELHESKLDTLIKRTKERERKLVEQSRNIQWYTSTPAYTEASSIEFPVSCSDVDVSIHSRSTLILEPRDNGYSLSIEGVCQSPTIERYFKYTPKPTIPLDDKLFPKIAQTNDFELKIKTETTVNIAAYSPTQSPDFQKFEIKEELIKKEIKIEPDVDKFL